MKRWEAVAALSLALLLLPFGAALGDKAVYEDPNDSPGDFDIETILQKHDGKGNRALLVHRVTTFESWDMDALEESGTDFAFFFFIENRIRRYVLVDVSPDGTPYAEITDWDTGRIVGFARVWRPDDRTLQIELPRKALGKGIVKYKWSASTSWHEDGHPQCGEDEHGPTSCIDHAPDQDEVTHKL